MPAEQRAAGLASTPTYPRVPAIAPARAINLPERPDLPCGGPVPHAHDFHALILPDLLPNRGFGQIGLAVHDAGDGIAELLRHEHRVNGVGSTASRKIRGHGKRANEN